jgi:prevent-host-death family protein
MKEATIEQLSRDPEGTLEAAQNERILVTRDGEPLAVIVGVEYKDAEDLQLEASADFWRMIEERRRQPTVRLADVEAEILTHE